MNLPTYERPTGGQMKVVQGAQSHNTVNVAPVARSLVAILISIGVKDEHLNGVWELFLSDERFMYRNPETPELIAKDAREVYATWLKENGISAD